MYVFPLPRRSLVFSERIMAHSGEMTPVGSAIPQDSTFIKKENKYFKRIRLGVRLRSLITSFFFRWQAKPCKIEAYGVEHNSFECLASCLPGVWLLFFKQPRKRYGVARFRHLWAQGARRGTSCLMAHSFGKRDVHQLSYVQNTPELHIKVTGSVLKH